MDLIPRGEQKISAHMDPQKSIENVDPPNNVLETVFDHIWGSTCFSSSTTLNGVVGESLSVHDGMFGTSFTGTLSRQNWRVHQLNYKRKQFTEICTKPKAIRQHATLKSRDRKQWIEPFRFSLAFWTLGKLCICFAPRSMQRNPLSHPFAGGKAPFKGEKYVFYKKTDYNHHTLSR